MMAFNFLRYITVLWLESPFTEFIKVKKMGATLGTRRNISHDDDDGLRAQTD